MKIVERGKINIPKTQMLDHSLSCLGTGTSLKKMLGINEFYGPKHS